MQQVGKYQLVRKLATGGMAEVFLAKAAGPMGFEKTLVLKRILPHLAEEPTFVQMFLAEAKLAARLTHPHIVQIFDFGEAGGAYFLAMEYIDGPSLRTLVKRAVAQGPFLPPAVCARIISHACEGLAFAHDFTDPETGEAQGLIHRDVSPDNILLSKQGAVKVVDFGIAKAAGQTHKTESGVIKGKYGYMPPEQLRALSLDRRVDVYALGVVLYELLTARRPFESATDAGLMQAILFESPMRVEALRPDLPDSLRSILERALARDREQRYPDCHAFQADLEEFILSAGKPVTTQQVAQLIGTSSSTELPLASPPPGGVGGAPHSMAAPSKTQATRPDAPQARVTPVQSSTGVTQADTPSARATPAKSSSVVTKVDAPQVRTEPLALVPPLLRPRQHSSSEPPVGAPPSASVPVQAQPSTTPAEAAPTDVPRRSSPSVTAVAKAQLPMRSSGSHEATPARPPRQPMTRVQAELPRSLAKPGRARNWRWAVLGGALVAMGSGVLLWRTTSLKPTPVAEPLQPIATVSPTPPAPAPSTPDAGVQSLAVLEPPLEPADDAGSEASAVGETGPSDASVQALAVLEPSDAGVQVDDPPSTNATPSAPPAAPPRTKSSRPVQLGIAYKPKPSAAAAPKPVATGSLNIRTSPDVTVILDGREIGLGTRPAMEVPVGKHLVKFLRKESGESVLKEVDVQRGENEPFKCRLVSGAC